MKKQSFRNGSKKIRIAIKTVIVILFFIIGYLIPSIYFTKPLTDNQFKLLEEVAEDIYRQYDKSDQTLIEVPGGIRISKTDTNINVYFTGSLGSVDAKLINGNLVTIRNPNTSASIVLNILSGAFLALLATAIILKK